MAGINIDTQYTGYVGHLKMEVGYIGPDDVTTVYGDDASESHSIPTTLKHVAAGWMVCSSTSGGTVGCITAAGPVEISTGDTTRDALLGLQPHIDFTMDATCAGTGGGNFYLVFGW